MAESAGTAATTIATLRDAGIRQASIEAVTAREPRLAPTPRDDLAAFYRDRESGFPGLIKIILEQQVSVRAALAMWEKLCGFCAGGVTPHAMLALDEAALKAAGFSRQKMRYAWGVAEAVRDGQLDFAVLDHSSDEHIVKMLTALKGIGRWSAEVYLLGCLARPDVWPAGDLALQYAVQHLNGLEARPDVAAMDDFAAAYAGHRSMLALLVWHYYRREQRPRAF